jgi:tRNA pseudouridine55 synthase
MNINGFLNLHKPAGITSHDCVARVRRVLGTKKVGHGGTLDPAATGVLPIAIGSCTRLLPYLPTAKAYRAVIRFGLRTTTDDLEGEVIEQLGAGSLDLAAVQAVMTQFVGQLQQVPPAYSAIQVDGRRSYDRARAGEEFTLPARPVEVYGIEVLNWQPGKLPELTVEIRCGGGTYIRSIARDLGAVLGCGATLANLVRTLSCNLPLKNAVALENLTDSVPLESPLTALQHLNSWCLQADQEKDWQQGRTILLLGGAFPAEHQPLPLGEPIVVSISSGTAQPNGIQFLGIGFVRTSSNGPILCPKVVLPSLMVDF